jgi:protein-S-isoprenylcysteine O-methyltransferase Ste14
MTPRTGQRWFRLSRNAITILLLGSLSALLVFVLSIPRITDIIPLFPDWLMSLLGWIHLGVGCLLLVSGIINQRVRELVARLEDLVICGPFRYVRRPMYGGLLMLLIGSGFVFNLTGLLITAGLWSLAASVYSQFEDRALKRRLGADYRYYRRTTPLLLPHLGRLIADFFRTE